MDVNKISRRRFFEKSLFMSTIPLTFSSMSSFVKSEVLDSNSISGVSDLERITILLKQKNPMVWVFTGDSITHGAKHTHGYRSYSEIFGERIRWEIGRVKDFVINTGISGNITQNILDDFDWRIKQFNPAVVSLMIGTNDCSTKDISLEVFERNLNNLLHKIRGLNALPILHTPNIIIKEKAPGKGRLSEYVSVIQNLSQREEVILIDNYTYWQNAVQNQGESAVFKKWLNDPIHPNGAGHSEVARLMFKTLSVFDPQAPTCGGLYYEGEH